MTDWKTTTIVFIILTIIFIGTTAYFAAAPPAVKTLTSTTTYVSTVTVGGGTVTTTITKTVGATTGVKTLKVFYFNPAPANVWYNLVTAGVKTAVKQIQAMGVKVTFQEYDATKLDQQMSQLQQAQALKPDVIVIGTISDAVQSLLKQLKQQGTTVILVDRDLPDKTARDLYFGTNNVYAAKYEAEMFLKWLQEQNVPKPWKIVIFKGLPAVPTMYLRYQGFMEALKPYIDKGWVKILAEVEVNQDLLTKCNEKAAQIIPKYGKDVTAYMATNLLQAMAIVKALQENNIVPGKDVYVLGFDAQFPSWVNMIKSGKVLLSIQQHPFTMGYWAVWAGYYIRAGILHVPPKAVINTPTYTVFPTNATYSLALDHFEFPPQEMLMLAQQLTPSNPQIQAPPYDSFSGG